MVLNKEHDFEKNVQGLFQGFCGLKKKAFLFLFFYSVKVFYGSQCDEKKKVFNY